MSTKSYRASVTISSQDGDLLTRLEKKDMFNTRRVPTQNGWCTIATLPRRHLGEIERVLTQFNSAVSAHTERKQRDGPPITAGLYTGILTISEFERSIKEIRRHPLGVEGFPSMGPASFDLAGFGTVSLSHSTENWGTSSVEFWAFDLQLGSELPRWMRNSAPYLLRNPKTIATVFACLDHYHS